MQRAGLVVAQNPKRRTELELFHIEGQREEDSMFNAHHGWAGQRRELMKLASVEREHGLGRIKIYLHPTSLGL